METKKYNGAKNTITCDRIGYMFISSRNIINVIVLD